MPDSGKVVLALGGELKNTIAMGLGAKILISPHHGNLSLYSAFKAFEEQVSAFSKLLRHRPQVVAIDQHPQYANSEWGRKYANENGLELIEVQHHHAHAVSCMAEHGLTESLALVFDGMGYFNDPGSGESLWGGELLHANLHGFERVGTFSQALLPGGDRAVRQPWRQAVARLLASGVLLKNYPNLLEKLKVNPQELLSLEEMLNKVPGIWKTSSVGRVFDSVAAMMGICEKELSYEGQAAIRLEKLARQAEMDTPIVSYPFEIQERDGIPHVELHGMISRLAEELAWNPATPQMALKFHDTIICASRELVAHAAEKTGLKDIVLSGGVFQNQLLVARMIPEIQSLGLKVYTHQRIPPNDGGLALGQAVIAMKLSGI
jgi:hydrogenase maturation protein HypF